LKLVLGLGLLAVLLLIDSNWRKVVDIVGDIQPAYLAPFLGVSFLTIWISCVKWRLFLHDHRKDLRIRRLMGLYVIGYFFNNFMPTNFGGDVVRSYILGRQIDSQERALSTVFLERFTGFFAMVSLAVGAFLFNPALRGEGGVLWAILLMCAITVGVIIAIFRPGLVRKMISLLPVPSVRNAIIERASAFHAHVIRSRGEWKMLAQAMLYSFGYYMLAAVKVYFAGLLLGIHCDLAQLLVVTPIVMLIAAVPLTPNSLGIQEWGYSVYLIFAGATMEQGLTIALLLRVEMILVSIMGGGLFLMEGEQATNSESDVSLRDDKRQSDGLLDLCTRQK